MAEMDSLNLKQWFHPGERVSIAVSGGLDSVSLLDMVLSQRDQLGIVVTIAHYNHHLRGDASDADATFVQDLAAARGVEIYMEAASSIHTSNIEARARDDRYAFFRRLGDQHGVQKVATAHTADDQAETVLTRLLRGGGPAGMAGILPVRDDFLIRPFLGVRRSELRSWAATRQLTWREDASNEDVRFLRNRIRHELIPHLERDYNPGIVEVLARTAEVCCAEEAHWQCEMEHLAEQLLDCSEGVAKLSLAKFVQLDEAQQRRLIRIAVDRAKGGENRLSFGLSFGHVESIRRLALRQDLGGEQRLLEIPGGTVCRMPGMLVFQSTSQSTSQTASRATSQD